MVLAIAAEFDFECWQLDYNTAFLNARVEEEVYTLKWHLNTRNSVTTEFQW